VSFCADIRSVIAEKGVCGAQHRTIGGSDPTEDAR